MDDIFLMEKGDGSADIGDYLLGLFLGEGLLFSPSVIEIAGATHILKDEIEIIFISETFIQMNNILMFNIIVNFNFPKDVLF
jgi:hypothetical protein